MFVVFCIGSGLCDELIAGSEKSYRMCVCACVCVCVYNLETSTTKRTNDSLRPNPHKDYLLTYLLTYLLHGAESFLSS